MDFDIDLGEILTTTFTQVVNVGAAYAKDQLIKPQAPAPAQPGVQLGAQPAAQAQVQAPPAKELGQPIEKGGYTTGDIALGAALLVGAAILGFLGVRAAKA